MKCSLSFLGCSFTFPDIHRQLADTYLVQTVNGFWWMMNGFWWIVDGGCWMLDVGCWMLEVGSWKLDGGW
jgi:hypothetical protein